MTTKHNIQDSMVKQGLDMEYFQMKCQVQEQELHTMEEENRKLKEANEELNEQIVDTAHDMGFALADAEDIQARAWADKEPEIKKLKEQNKTLEEIHNGDMKIVKMLKEKLEVENNKIKYYEFFVNVVDPKCYGANNLEKEDVDKYTADEELRKFLYEQIHYEEEEELDDEEDKKEVRNYWEVDDKKD